MTILFATGNQHKAQEIARIFAPHTIKTPSDLGITFNPEETENTFLGNALIKARTLHELTQLPVIADDSGLCVDALNGEPGIYSARFGSIDGKELTSSARNALLISRLSGQKNRSARFICNMIIYLSKDRFVSAQETLEGTIVTHQGAGSGGFGYDPILFIPEFGKTVAELSAEEKDRVSHRGKASQTLKVFLDFLK